MHKLSYQIEICKYVILNHRFLGTYFEKLWLDLLDAEEKGRVAEGIRVMFLKSCPWILKDAWNILRRILNTCDLGRPIKNWHWPKLLVPSYSGVKFEAEVKVSRKRCLPSTIDNSDVWGRKMVKQFWALLPPWCLCSVSHFKKILKEHDYSYLYASQEYRVSFIKIYCCWYSYNYVLFYLHGYF